MARRPLAPLWLSRPSRLAGLSRSAARVGLVILALVIAMLLVALEGRDAGATASDAALADAVLQETIVDEVRHGANYYPAAADTLRGAADAIGGAPAPRPPTLAVVEATLPHALAMVMLAALAIAVALAWWRVFIAELSLRWPRVAALALLACALAMMVRRDFVSVHEAWAGLLIALSLALRRPREWIAAIAIGTAAALICDTAMSYLAIMAVFAWIEGSRREALGWMAGAALVAAALVAHAYALGIVGDLPASPATARVGDVIQTMASATLFTPLPSVLIAALAGCALLGWSAWRDARAPRVLALLVGCAVLLATVSRGDVLAAWLVAPLLPIALVAVPDALRDLIAAAFDRRRRIVVRRVVR